MSVPEKMDCSPTHKPFDEDQVDLKYEEELDVKPEAEQKPEIQIVEEVAADSSAVTSHVVAKAKEAEILRMAEEILANNARRHASFAGLMCTLLDGDSTSLKEALNVLRLIILLGFEILVFCVRFLLLLRTMLFFVSPLWARSTTLTTKKGVLTRS